MNKLLVLSIFILFSTMSQASTDRFSVEKCVNKKMDQPKTEDWIADFVYKHGGCNLLYFEDDKVEFKKCIRVGISKAVKSLKEEYIKECEGERVVKN